jgi:hypothetical protein
VFNGLVIFHLLLSIRLVNGCAAFYAVGTMFTPGAAIGAFVGWVHGLTINKYFRAIINAGAKCLKRAGKSGLIGERIHRDVPRVFPYFRIQNSAVLVRGFYYPRCYRVLNGLLGHSSAFAIAARAFEQ